MRQDIIYDNPSLSFLIYFHRIVNNNTDKTTGDIAGSSAPCRDLVLQAEAMPPLLQQIHQNSKLSMLKQLRDATYTVCSLCSGQPLPDFEMVRPCLPTLSQLISSCTDEEVLIFSCLALQFLSYEKKQAVIVAGVCGQQLVRLLSHSSQEVQLEALRTVGNIVNGDDSQMQCIIDNHALPNLCALCFSPRGREVSTCR